MKFYDLYHKASWAQTRLLFNLAEDSLSKSNIKNSGGERRGGREKKQQWGEGSRKGGFLQQHLLPQDSCREPSLNTLGLALAAS